MPIPNFPKDHGQKVIITPRQHLLAEEEAHKNFHVPKACILCFEQYIMDNVHDYYEVESTTFWNGDIHYFKDSDKKIALMGNFGIGGPASAHLLEILIAAGTESFIVIGHAGGLQKRNEIGKIVLCDRAIRDDGVSHHYLKDEKYAYPSLRLTTELHNELVATTINFEIGSTWTLDSMYRETIDEVKYYEKEGVATVEMEAASLFAVGQFRNVDVASMFVISDHVIFNIWEEQLNTKDTKKMLFQALGIAKTALHRRIQ